MVPVKIYIEKRVLLRTSDHEKGGACVIDSFHLTKKRLLLTNTGTVGEQAQVCFFSDATKNNGWGLDG